MAKFKLCCIKSTQIIIVSCLVALTSYFIYLGIQYVSTNSIVDQYSNIPYQDMDCQVLRCKYYREMPDYLNCCDAFGNECSSKADCLAALYFDTVTLSSQLWRTFQGMVIAYVLFIWFYRRLKDKAERIETSAVVQRLQINNEQFNRDLQEFRIRFRLGRRNAGQNVGRNQQGGASLLTESFIANDNDNCAICLDEYGEERVVKLQCEHIFHRQCIEKWRQVRSNCPLCRNIQN